ncbi:hypothetical protein ACVXHA_24185 [Escherichia coli]
MDAFGTALPRAGFYSTVSVNSQTLRAQARCWQLNWTRWVKH